MAITFRDEKGAPLTHEELDANFRSFFFTASFGENNLTLQRKDGVTVNIPVGGEAFADFQENGGSIGDVFIANSQITGSRMIIDLLEGQFYDKTKGPYSDGGGLGSDEWYIDFDPAPTAPYYVHFGPNFAISSSGILYASGARIEGDITASSGLIGGFSITADAISGPTFLGTPSFYISGSAGTNDYFISASNFNIKGSGNITGSAVLFTGGKIAGWEITNSQIRKSSNIVLDATNESISIKNSTFGNQGIQLEYNSGNPRFYVGNGASSFVQFDGTDVTVSTRLLEISASNIEISSTEASMSLGNGAVQLLGSEGKITAGITNKVRIEGNATDAFLAAGTKTGFATDAAGIIIGMDATVPTLDLTKDASNYFRFNTNDGVDIRTNTFKLDTTYFDIDTSTQRLNIFDTASAEIIRLGEISDDASDLYGIKIFDGSGTGSAQTIAMFGQQGNKIGGWEVTNSQIRTIPDEGFGGQYGEDEVGLIIHSSGRLESSNFVTNVKGWRIDTLGNGSAEFENMRIRGTLRTTVFEKESVNVVGGQLMIANATTIQPLRNESGSIIAGSSSYGENAVTFSVANVSGFTEGEILKVKSVDDLGFSVEYLYVSGSSRYSQNPNLSYNTGSIDPDGLAGELYVQRSYGGIVAVSSSITTLSSDIPTTTETAIHVADASGLTLQDIIKIDDERFKITGKNNNTLTVIRDYGDTIPDSHTAGDIVYLIDTDKEFLSGLVSTARPYNEGQVIVSTGVYNPGKDISSGYILMNANPRDVSTPYMDIIERTGSGVYDLQLRTRLGDLSGLSSGYLYGNDEPGFGLYTDNGFFRGAITAQTGSITGILHIATELGGTETGQKISIGREVQGSNDGIFVNNNNYWYTDGAWKVGGSQNFISLDNFTDGNLTIRTETFTLDTPNMIISSSLNNGTITMGANADTITETAEAGIYMDGNGRFRVGDATTGDNYIYWDGSTLNIKGAIDITGGTGVTQDQLNTATGSAISSSNAFTNQQTSSLASNIKGVTDTLDGKIFTDSSGRAVRPPTASNSGLYLASTNLGYYDSGKWKTYMDNSGNFYLTGSSGGRLAWDAASGTLDIKGSITVTAGGNAATQTYVSSSVATASGSLATALSASNAELSGSIQRSSSSLAQGISDLDIVASGKASIFRQGTSPLITGRTVGDVWIHTGEQNKMYIWVSDEDGFQPSPDGTYDQAALINSTSASLKSVISLDIFTDSTGRIVRTPDTSSNGLYLGDSNLGFYSQGEWKTYMGDNGKFYLTGSESNYLTWDGTSLNIAGSINITGGNATTKTDLNAATGSLKQYAQGKADQAESNAKSYTNSATASLSGSFSSSLSSVSASLASSVSSSAAYTSYVSRSQAEVNEGVVGFLAGKNSIFRQNDEPTSEGRVNGDIWIDTNSTPPNKVHVWEEDQFVATPDETYNQTELIRNTSESIAETIFTDATGRIQKPATTTGEGLFMDSTNLGYYADGKWKTYMSNNGNFFLTASNANSYLAWENGTLTIAGQINVIGGNAATQDYVNDTTGSLSSSLSQSIAEESRQNSASAAAAQDTATIASGEAAAAQQAALSASLLAKTAVTRSVDAEGKITFPATPSGAGLFMGSRNLGYYNGNEWKTYMSSSGDFYLSGDGNSGLSWDGSELSIDGGVIARTGSIGGIDLEADKMYIGTGTYSNNNTKFYVDNTGKFSLGDKLVWDGSSLTITGDITVTNENDFASQAELNSVTASIEGINSTTSSLVNPSIYKFGPSNSFTLGAITPNAAGLYLGSNNLGYYNGGWKAYMDSSGNFLLSGAGDDGLTWNGSTLRIGNKGVGPSLAYQFNGALDSNVFDHNISTTYTINTPVIGSRFHDNGGSWNQGFHSKAIFDRQDGVIFEWDIMVGPAWAEVMVGLYKENPSNYQFNQMSHAVFFDTDNDIHIYEAGSQRSEIGINAWTTDNDYSEKQTFRIRIQPLPTGAKYEIFKNGDFTTPAYTYDSSTNNITERYLRPGAAINTPNAPTTGVIFQGMAGGASLGQATKISGNTIQTGVIESSNLSTTLGSQFNLNDGTFKLGGTSSPKLNWNGSTLSIVGNITVTNPESFATPAQKNKEDFKIILVATGSLGTDPPPSITYLSQSLGYTGGNGNTYFYDNNNDSDGNTNPANISGYDTQDYDLYVFDCRNWGINGSEIKLALDLFDNGKSVLIAGNDTSVANYTGSYNTEWPIKASEARSGSAWMAGPSASGKGLPASHPILAGISGNVGIASSSDTGILITQLKAFPKGGTVVQPFSITDETTSVANIDDVFTTYGTGQGITSFIATNPRGGRMVNLNLFALAAAPIGYYSLSAQAAKNLTSFLLRTDPAIEAHYMQVTSITGEMVTTGKIQSSNLNVGTGTYTTAGTFFDLDNGAIKSKAFAIDSAGNANFRGDLSGSNITGTNGTFTGTVRIGGTDLTPTNTFNSNTTKSDVGLGNVDNTSDATVLAAAYTTASLISPILYTFKGNDGIPTTADGSGAKTYTFTSNREGTARLRLVLNDAEATGTYPNYAGIQASVNGNKLLTRLSIYDLGLADGSDGTFFDTVQVVSGSNNIKIWSSNGDGGTTKELEVIYTQTEDITSGSAGGWTIDSSAIFSGTKDTNTFSANGITFSSANGGSIHAEQFYIDTNGNAFFKGDLNGASITGATGTFTGTVQVGGTDLTVANTLNTEDPMSAGAVNFNPNFLKVASDGRPAGVRAVYGSSNKSNISYSGSSAEGVVKLVSPGNYNDTTIGAGFSAFRINPGAKYKFVVRIKGQSNTNSGLFIRFAEKHGELASGKDTVSWIGSGNTTAYHEYEVDVVDSNSGLNVSTGNHITDVTIDGTSASSLEDIGMTTSYRVIQGIYTPSSAARSASAAYASMAILNWSGNANNAMYIDRVYISETTEDIYTGTVAGWNIDSNAIYSGDTKDTDGFAQNGGITLSSGGSIHAKQFYISSSGDAFFKGNISGASGQFSGEVRGGLVTGSQVIGGTVVGGSINVPNQANPRFTVDSTGNMTAQDAVITGSLNIERGRLGSWIIQDVEEGGQLKDITGQVRLDSVGREISVYSGSEAGGYTQRVRIKAEDSLTDPTVANITVTGIPNSNLTKPSDLTSLSTSQTYNIRTQTQSTTSNSYNIPQAGTYGITGLAKPYSFFVNTPSGTVVGTADYPIDGGGWSDPTEEFNIGAASPKEHVLSLYLEAVYQADTSITSRVLIHSLLAKSATREEGYSWVPADYATDEFSNDTPGYWSPYSNTINASNNSYTNGYAPIPSVDLNFPKAGNYKFRYVLELKAKSGRSINKNSNYTDKNPVYYTTTASMGSIASLQATFDVIIPTNIIEITGGGVQIIQDSEAYIKMPRFDGYGSTTIPTLFTMRGGMMEIKTGGFITADDKTLWNYGKTYTYGLEVDGTDGNYPWDNPIGGVSLPSMSKNGNIRSTIYLRGDIIPAPSSPANTTANTNRDIASTSYYWDDIYADDFRNQSDIRAKENIANSNLGLTFINSLRPVQYNMKESTKKRTRYGFIAQEVASALSDLGLTTQNFKGLATGSSEVKRLERDYEKPIAEIIASGSYFDSEDTGSGVVTQEWYDDIQENTMWNLNYLEFIAPLTKAVQELSAKVAELEAQISSSL